MGRIKEGGAAFRRPPWSREALETVSQVDCRKDAIDLHFVHREPEVGFRPEVVSFGADENNGGEVETAPDAQLEAEDRVVLVKGAAFRLHIVRPDTAQGVKFRSRERINGLQVQGERVRGQIGTVLAGEIADAELEGEIGMEIPGIGELHVES